LEACLKLLIDTQTSQILTPKTQTL
jgi:hypothetical protein